jgi:hypothetical protein
VGTIPCAQELSADKLKQRNKVNLLNDIVQSYQNLDQ